MGLPMTSLVSLTHSKIQTIIIRRMCMTSLIVFTDKYLGHVWTFYTNDFSLHSNYIQIHKRAELDLRSTKMLWNVTPLIRRGISLVSFSIYIMTSPVTCLKPTHLGHQPKTVMGTDKEPSIYFLSVWVVLSDQCAIYPFENL